MPDRQVASTRAPSPGARLRLRELTGAYRRLIGDILDLVDPQIQAKVRQWPLYIQSMGDGVATRITRFVRQGQPGEHSSRDYDFSDIAIRTNREQGYALARETLEKTSTDAAAAEDDAPLAYRTAGIAVLHQPQRPSGKAGDA